MDPQLTLLLSTSGKPDLTSARNLANITAAKDTPVPFPTMSTEPGEPFRFLDLPGEVRTRIYELLLPDEAAMGLSGTQTFINKQLKGLSIKKAENQILTHGQIKPIPLQFQIDAGLSGMRWRNGG